MTPERQRWKRLTFDQPYTIHNSIEWYQSGNKYFDCLESLIDSAKKEIHLQTYIFASDTTGTKIAEALIRAAERKVEIFVLVDAYGSQSLATALIKRMKLAGINFRKYGQLYSQGRFHIGRRMHHKITVIDGITSIVGGINVSDHYNDMPDSPAWLDFAVIMRGDISRRLQFVCRRRWSGWIFTYTSARTLLKNIGLSDKSIGNIPIRIRRNDFIRNRNEITVSYREALRRSEKSLVIVGGYFLPGGRSRRLMKAALNRGVSINVIVSEKSDVGVMIAARRWLYDWLIRNKVGVYEYRPSNVHGKVIVSDDKWTSIGSYDLNNLSAYSNIELNVDIRNEEFSKGIADHIRKIMKEECNAVITDEKFRHKSWLKQFWLWISYRFVKTLFILSVLLAGKKEKEF
jgi:cardiolipin synthase